MTKTTRCKFKCENISGDDDNKQVSLVPVYSDDPNHENASFWKYTPAGQINLTITNPNASNIFKVDKEYYVDISEAE